MIACKQEQVDLVRDGKCDLAVIVSWRYATVKRLAISVLAAGWVCNHRGRRRSGMDQTAH